MFTRRSFNKSIFVGAIGSSVIATSSQAQNSSANDRLQLGFIGVGTMGRGHLGNFLGMKGDGQISPKGDVAKRFARIAAQATGNIDRHERPASQL